MFGYLRQMGASYQHSFALQFKYSIRSYLLGRICELVGSKYNVSKDTEDNSLAQGSFSLSAVGDSQHDLDDTETFHSELLISAMLFSCDPRFDIGDRNDSAYPTVHKHELEEAMKTEGLRYIGGFIAHKFRRYSNLGTNVTPEDKTWIGKICRHKGKLMTPSNELFEQLKIIEKLFECYHGKKSLKTGRKCMKNLTTLICVTFFFLSETL